MTEGSALNDDKYSQMRLTIRKDQAKSILRPIRD